MEKDLIAPCGMNCGLCSSYLAWRKDTKSQGIKMPYCAGCRPRDKQCAFLKKRCPALLNGRVEYCYQCQDFPCQNLQKIDRRYLLTYRLSMIENLKIIQNQGIAAFLFREEGKWRCPDCGGVICCHNGLCYDCSLDKLGQKARKYRWE